MAELEAAYVETYEHLRRSTAQIRAYDWNGDPEPYLPIIPAYQARDDNIVE